MSGIDRLRLIVAWAVFVLWAVSTIADYFSPSYDVPAGLQAAMMIVVGFLFTPTVIKAATRHTNGDDS